MKSELAEWNNGSGIDLESWISCSGSYHLAVGYAEYFWPEFDIVDDFIVRAGTTSSAINLWRDNGCSDRRAIEATMNHMHLIDINYHDHEKLSEDILMRLGTVLVEIYEAKLLWQFPKRPCTVSLFVPEERDQFDQYQITFWQKAHEQNIEEANKPHHPTPRGSLFPMTSHNYNINPVSIVFPRP